MAVSKGALIIRLVGFIGILYLPLCIITPLDEDDY
jgi:hypothetical protein